MIFSFAIDGSDSSFIVLQMKLNVLSLLPAELQQLYQYLEVEFNPLHLCRKVMPILESLEQQEHCMQYVDMLKQVLLVRLIKQVSNLDAI